MWWSGGHVVVILPTRPSATPFALGILVKKRQRESKFHVVRSSNSRPSRVGGVHTAKEGGTLPLDSKPLGRAPFRIKIATLDPSLPQPFFHQFFQHLWYRLLFDFRVQLGGQNQPKIIKNRYQDAFPFTLHFLSIFQASFFQKKPS